MRWLDEAIRSYTGTEAYPFHMPGAKRRNPGLAGDPFDYDITEIDGFDDLRNAQGLLAELEHAWAELYGAGTAFLSVNGSTGSNLSVIFAATEPSSVVLYPPSAHWSVSNAVSLRCANPAHLVEEQDENGITQAIRPEAVQAALDEHPQARIVVITSPTYEGLCSDIREIARIVHRRDAALVVDAAHGAHLGLPIWKEAFCQQPNPISMGADAVVVSLHKTLPVLGQTSLVLLPKEPTDGDELRIAPAKVKSYLNRFQTSSPSYLLMSAAACGGRFLLEQGRTYAAEFERNLSEFYEAASGLTRLSVLRKDNQDLSKIVITTTGLGISGQDLMKRLRDDYRLELERAGTHYALALCSIMDRREGFRRLAEALGEIDSGG